MHNVPNMDNPYSTFSGRGSVGRWLELLRGVLYSKLSRSKAVLAPGLKLGLDLDSSALKSPVTPA